MVPRGGIAHRAVSRCLRLAAVLLLVLAVDASSSGSSSGDGRAGEEGVATAAAVVVPATRWGTIVSCSGCALDQMPGLRVWMQDRDYEFYDHLEVRYEKGVSPVLRVWTGGNDGGTIGADEVAVSLLDVETVEQVEAILTAQGFRRKTDDEIAAIRSDRHRLVEQADRVIREMVMAQEMQQPREQLQPDKPQGASPPASAEL